MIGDTEELIGGAAYLDITRDGAAGTVPTEGVRFAGRLVGGL